MPRDHSLLRGVGEAVVDRTEDPLTEAEKDEPEPERHLPACGVERTRARAVERGLDARSCEEATAIDAAGIRCFAAQWARRWSSSIVSAMVFVIDVLGAYDTTIIVIIMAFVLRLNTVMPHLCLPASEREGFWHEHARRLLSGNLGSPRARGGGREHALHYVHLLSRVFCSSGSGCVAGRV